jgi:O-antigen ligase
MSAITTGFSPLVEDYPKPAPKRTLKPDRPDFGSLAPDVLQPNILVRWAFYVSVFCIPFTQLYLPGTGNRIGVVRMVQALIVAAILSQPRACVRLIPVALFWFLVYCGVRLFSGLWFTPELSDYWWPSSLHWLQFSLPWAWVMFNVLQFPGMGRQGLLALVAGGSLCALLHLAGIGVVEVAQGIEGRTTVFGENANVVGSTYAIAAIALVGLAMFKDVKLFHRLMSLPLIALILAAMAKTGSRTAFLILLMGIAVLFWQGQAFGSRIKRLATVVLVGAVLAGVVTQIPTAMERFEKLEATRIQEQEGRVRMIPVLWEMFLRSPVYGSGPDDYQFELTRRAMPHLLREQRLVTAHNLALKLLVETGLMGFLLFAWGVKSGLMSAWKARCKPCGPLPLAFILPLAIAGIIVSDPSHLLVFWFAVAYALAGAS